jgi:hypothetical protein
MSLRDKDVAASIHFFRDNDGLAFSWLDMAFLWLDNSLKALRLWGSFRRVPTKVALLRKFLSRNAIFLIEFSR